MTRAPMRALLLAIILAAVLAALAFAGRRPAELPQRFAAERPALLLLTSLPLMFGEQFALDAPGSPALEALDKRYRVIPISVTSPPDLAKGRLLLMAQPSAQTPENLVALDEWVRGGGHVLLLADPMLEWPSNRPLGDVLRPSPMFADTGLLGHWGLRLDSPEERGPRMAEIGGREVMTASPGTLHGKCRISSDRLVARCRLAKGAVTVIADADLLDIEHLDGPVANNIDAIMSELAALEH